MSCVLNDEPIAMRSLITTLPWIGSTPVSSQKSFGQTNPLVDNKVVREARHLVVWHRIKVTKRIRVAQRPVLAEALPQVAA